MHDVAKKMRYLLHYKCILLLYTLAVSQGAAVQKFYIAGLFPNDIADPQDRVRLGVYPEIAAELAVRQVNEGGLLSAHNVSLEMLSFGSSCDQAAAVYAYLQLTTKITSALASQSAISPPYVVLGPACDQPTYFTAALTSRYLKDIQISYSATTPLLSDTERFPLFYRTVPSYSNYGRAIFALMQHFDWLFVGVVHQEVSHYTRALEDLNSFLTTSSSRNDNTPEASVIVSLGLSSYLSRSVNMSSNARIFIGMFPEYEAADTICTAYRAGMTGVNFQWILLGDYQEDWWQQFPATSRHDGGTGGLRCTDEEMLQATESILILTYHLQPAISRKADKSTYDRQFWEEFATLVNTTTDDPFRPQLATRVEPAYDAIWTIAHALEAVLNPESVKSPDTFEYSDLNDEEDLSLKRSFSFTGRPIGNFTKELNAALERIDFEGRTGRIVFNSSSHSKHQPLTYILQMQSGHMIPIGIHNEEGLNLTVYSNELIWLGESPPRDRPVRELQSVALWLLCVVMIAALVGVVCAVSVLVVNCVYRKHKVIKASSPYLNLVIILGCIMGFLSIFFMSMDNLRSYFNIRLSVFPFFCNIRLWLLTIGFTLAFGALFAKTWRIYVIFRNPWKRKRPYKDHILLCMVAVFLLFDLLILILWVSIDPLILVDEIQVDLGDFIERRYEYCVSQYTPGSTVSFTVWITIIIIPKALLLAFGIFLVVQTSRIKAKFFRDAKFTGIAIFGFVMACGVGVPVALVSMFLFEEELGYIAATSTILICSYLILIMVFIPKFVLLKRYRKNIPSAVLIGLNPSFRIHRKNRIQASITFTPRTSHYARMLRGANDSISSRCSNSSSSSSSDECSTPRKLRVNDTDDIGWESAFDGISNLEIEVQETKLTFDEFEYIATIEVPRRSSDVSTNTVMTVVSEDSKTDRQYYNMGGAARLSTSGHAYRLSSCRSGTCDTIIEAEELGSLEEVSISLPSGSRNRSISTPAANMSLPTGAATLGGHGGHQKEAVDARRALYVRAKSKSLTIIPSPVPE